MRALAFAALLLPFAGVVGAQNPALQVRPIVIQPIEAQVPSQNVANVAADPVQVLQKRVVVLGKNVQALKSRVASLEEVLREMRDKTTFTCTAQARSSNGAGDSEDCGPLACNYVTGQCRTTAATSDHCAAGYLWDNGRCVVPPPAAPEENCGFLGLGCL